MTYKGYNIYANAKSYSLWSIDDDGKLHELEHEFEGYDFISYTFGNDEILDGEFGDFESLSECKNAIDGLKVRSK